MTRPLRLTSPSLPLKAIWVPIADIGGPELAEDFGLKYLGTRVTTEPLPHVRTLGLDARQATNLLLLDTRGRHPVPIYEARFPEPEPAWTNTIHSHQQVLLLASPAWTEHPSLAAAVQACWAGVIQLATFAFPTGVGTRPRPPPPEPGRATS